jgi:hemerythrin-like metal-binding protein
MVNFEELHVGHEEMDEQHRALVRRLADLERAVGAEDPAAFTAALGKLWDDTVGHFATEDALMEAFAYPERAPHRTAHHLFLEDLRALVREAELHGMSDDVASWAMQRVPAWLTFHIETNDAPLARFVARKEARQMLASATGEQRPATKRQES